VLVLSLVVAATAPTEAGWVWVHETKGVDEYRVDMYECRRDAAMLPPPPPPVRYGRQSDYFYAGVQAGERDNQQRGWINRCMRARGWWPESR
jgi:hypothetical protein